MVNCSASDHDRECPMHKYGFAAVYIFIQSFREPFFVAEPVTSLTLSSFVQVQVFHAVRLQIFTPMTSIMIKKKKNGVTSRDRECIWCFGWDTSIEFK